MTASLAAYPWLRDSHGSVVMIGSVSGTRPSPGTAAYGAAKAGLENLARSMAVEWAPEVRVNSLLLGMVRTELSHLHYGDEAGIAASARPCRWDDWPTRRTWARRRCSSPETGPDT